MKLSEYTNGIDFPLEMNRAIQVETKTDAVRLIYNDSSLQQYIYEYGDVEVETNYNCRYNPRLLSVPSHREAVDRYTEAKIKDCARWGCN
jgi:hypothetical protein